MVESRCKEKVSPPDRWGSFHRHQCSRKVWRDGYCKQHHPDSVSARQELAFKKDREKWESSPSQQVSILRRENEQLKKMLKNLFDAHYGIAYHHCGDGDGLVKEEAVAIVAFVRDGKI